MYIHIVDQHKIVLQCPKILQRIWPRPHQDKEAGVSPVDDRKTERTQNGRQLKVMEHATYISWL